MNEFDFTSNISDLFTTDPELADALTGHGEVSLRTKPTTSQMAREVNYEGKPVQAGDRLPFWTGTEVDYYVITKSDMVKVERFRSRAAKQRQHLADKIAREDQLAERALREARRAEATRRQAAASDALRTIHAASK